MKMRILWALLFVAILGCDQAGKYAALSFPKGGIEVIPGFFRLVYAENPGVAFSSLVGAPPWLLALLASGVIVWIFITLLRTPDDQRFTQFGYVLVLAGAIGNVIDRIRLGHVIDFILWHIGDKFYWPVFNPADAAVVVGIALLFLQPKSKVKA